MTAAERGPSGPARRAKSGSMSDAAPAKEASS